MNVRVYYLNAEYEPGKHKIVTLSIPGLNVALPEDDPVTAINVPYTVIEIDLKYNRWVISKLTHLQKSKLSKFDIPHLQFVDLYYVNNLGQICDLNNTVMVVAPNPEKADWVASVIAGATDAQIDTWFQNNVTTLAQARTVMAMMAKLIARIARQAGLE